MNYNYHKYNDYEYNIFIYIYLYIFIYIYFIHPISINNIFMNQKVLLINTTYKTNKYWMPILYVVRCTTFNNSIIVVLVFMTSKKVGFY